MEYQQKLVYQSNHWYNDGLKKANIRDLSGAITSLKKSLQFNSENIAARNLLGLVYYGRGEVGEAIVEWILSKNIRSHDNIAGYFIQKITENPGELLATNQVIRKYNQSLTYCNQGGEDLAIIQLKQVVAEAPGFLRAQQLLALLYLHTEQYDKARKCLKEAQKIDTTDEITLRYLHELTQTRHLLRRENGNTEENGQTVTYQVGNDTIIAPSASVPRDMARMIIVYGLAGFLIGLAAMWFLAMPSVRERAAKNTNEQIISFSDKIAEKEAQISALKTELDTYRVASEDTEAAKETAASTRESYEIVIQMYTNYLNGDVSDEAMVDELMKVNPDSLGEIGKARYQEMTGTLYERYGETLYYIAQDNYYNEDYESAIANLTKLMEFNEGYGEGKGLLLLYWTYTKSGDEENANAVKAKLDKNYPDVDTSEEAWNGGGDYDESYDDYDDYDEDYSDYDESYDDYDEDYSDYDESYDEGY